MNNIKAIATVIVVLICIILYLIFSGKDPMEMTSLKTADLLGKMCSVAYGESDSPANAHGIIKLMDEKWVLLLVEGKDSNGIFYEEFWIPTNRIMHIVKSNQ